MQYKSATQRKLNSSNEADYIKNQLPATILKFNKRDGCVYPCHGCSRGIAGEGHHLATILKFTNRGVKRLGRVNTLFAKSFINK